MKQLIISILSRFFPELPTLVCIYRHAIRNKDSYINVTGWTKSIAEKRPCLPDGSAVPYMNYPVVNLLQGRLNKTMRMFEYGSGYSTLFFSRLVGDLVSLEYDRPWYEKISKELPKNAHIIFVTNDVDASYCRSITQVEGLFDIVLVDGRDRVNCIKHALGKLSEGGILVLDDSQRERYKEGIEHAVGQGFKRLDLAGLKPTEYGMETTTIFYRSTNCLNL
jgi:hypothetical protein